MPTLKIPVTPADHVVGRDDAPVTLVEYGDYECPACGRAHPIVNRVRQHFGEALRFVFRHFPLTEIHPNAESAAESAEFADAHGRFWEMHDALFGNQDRLGPPLLFAVVSALGLPERELERSLREETYAAAVRSHFLGGVRSGVNGTPTFFINGGRHDGPFDFEHLAGAVALALPERKARAGLGLG
jgi:protein-disulfide isomerase